MIARKIRKPPAVGSRVTLEWGGYPVKALVTEDRGNLGVGGRQVLRFRLEFEPDTYMEPFETEWAVDRIPYYRKPKAAPASTAPSSAGRGRSRTGPRKAPAERGRKGPGS